MNPLMSVINPSNLTQVNINSIKSIISLLQSKSPSELTTELLNSNPQFGSFYEANKNKSAEQICNENGIDFSLIKQFLNK